MKKTRAEEACAMEVSFGFVLRKKRESDEACETQWRWCILDKENSFLGKKICLGVKRKVGGGDRLKLGRDEEDKGRRSLCNGGEFRLCLEEEERVS